MKQSLYIETSVVSYYSSRPSRDIIVLAHQEITRQWWPRAIKNFNIFVSEIVIREASMGDKEAAKKRLDDIKNFRILDLTEEVERIAQVYFDELKLPRKAFGDAVHLAVACVYHMDYLVTWNCTHLANGQIIKRLSDINTSYQLKTSVICTPEELMEVSYDMG